MLPNIYVVVFDLDGTLCDRRRSFERLFEINGNGFWLDRDGYAPRKALFTGLVAQFELPSGLAETLRNEYRASHLLKTVWCFT